MLEGPTNLCRATQTGFDDNAVKRRDGEQVRPPQQVVAVDNGRDRQLRAGFRRRRARAHERNPEIEVPVVFPYHELGLAGAIDQNPRHFP